MCCGESPSQESKENQSLEEENHSFKMNVETKRTKEWEAAVAKQQNLLEFYKLECQLCR